MVSQAACSVLAEGITLSAQLDLTGRRFCDPPYQV
jgi:hypothetical protein